MELVVDNTAEDCKRLDAQANLTHCVRRLAVNLLRVIAGAGKPDMLAAQIDAAAEASRLARDLGGPGFMGGRKMLDPVLVLIENRPWISDRYQHGQPKDDKEAAENDMVRAALRVAAATLADQMTQRSSAENAMFEATRRVEKMRAERRRDWDYP